MKDEMIIADEAHMKKLQKGSLNFQRVAFEQRVRKGRTMNRLSSPSLSPTKRHNIAAATEESEATSQDDDDEELQDMQRISEEESVNKEPHKVIPVLPLQSIPEEESVGIDPHKSSPVESAVVEDGQKPCCSKSLDETPSSRSPPSVLKKSVGGSVGDAKSATVHTASGTKRKNSDNPEVEATTKEIKKRRVTFSTQPPAAVGTKPLRGIVEEFIGTSNGFLNGSFSKLSNHEHTTKYKSTSRCCQRKRTLVYTQLERKHSKQSGFVDIFKETRLFASRTSLAMHRSLNFERLDPTNAMNTHDALVMNPVKVKVNMVVSPYRSFFSKAKHKLTDKENEMWQRIKASDRINDVNLNRLSSEDLAEVLRESLQCGEDLIAEHLQVVSIIKAAGNVGVDLNSLNVNHLVKVTIQSANPIPPIILSLIHI